jgi:hypothetical protein
MVEVPVETRRGWKQRLARLHLLTVLVCVPVVLAFAGIDHCGRCYSHGVDNRGMCSHSLRHGWPAPFAEHTVTCPWELTKATAGKASGLSSRIPFRDAVDLRCWNDFRIGSVTGMILDVLLQLLLVAAMAVAALRLEKRNWRQWQFSLADMFSLTAAVSMVLGLIYLDRAPLAPNMYLPVQAFPLLDRVAILAAVGCAVWLIVSTAANGLGDKCAKTRD